jgi:hypothetical protein
MKHNTGTLIQIQSGIFCLFTAFQKQPNLHSTSCYFLLILFFSVGMIPADIFSGKSAERIASSVIRPLCQPNRRKFTTHLRSGFKTSDLVQGLGVRPIEKAQHTWVCEHLSEACNAAIGP